MWETATEAKKKKNCEQIIVRGSISDGSMSS